MKTNLRPTEMQFVCTYSDCMTTEQIENRYIIIICSQHAGKCDSDNEKALNGTWPLNHAKVLMFNRIIF